MHSLKKINSDHFLLILLVIHLGLDPFINSNNRRRWGPEDRSVLLGDTSAYTQSIFHATYDTQHYNHLKHLEYNEYDEAMTLFSRLHYFNSIRSRRDVITCIVDSPNLNHMQPSPRTSSEEVEDQPSLPELSAASTGNEEEISNFQGSDQLSPEDMDLIEILWKQDVDLGVRRDAYDSHLSSEIEKLKEVGQSNEKNTNDSSNTQEDIVLVPDPLAGFNYTIDSETGEYLIEGLLDPGSQEQFFNDDTKILDNDVLDDHNTSTSLTRDSYLPFDESDGFCDLNEIFTSSQIDQLLPDDFSIDSDYLSQIEDLEKELERFESLDGTNEVDELASEMYPSMDDCWSDTTTMLPLLTLGSAHPAPFSPRPLHGYPSFENSSLHFPIIPAGRPGESFLSMLQGTSLDMPPTEEEYQSLSSGVGVTSIGCAVAESIATLTNDTDPLPSHSIINAVYSSEFPDLLYANHTADVPHNDMLMSNLILEDGLQLVTIPPEENKQKQNEERMDTSNDSTPLTSSQLPVVPEYHEWVEAASESSSSHHGEREDIIRPNVLSSNLQVVSILSGHPAVEKTYTGLTLKKIKSNSENQSDNEGQSFNEQTYEHQTCSDDQYYSFKPSYSSQAESAACGDVDEKIGFRKYEYEPPKTACSSSEFVHYNHSYHLPFSLEMSKRRPVTRDKSTNSSDDDHFNKDDRKAKELKLPISIDDIINLAIDEYNERLSKYELSEEQLTLIRDIRRRGKNKVAAQNCRKRKMDQISHLQHDLSYLDTEKLQLNTKHTHLLRQKNLYEEKYSQLYNLILQNTNSAPPDPLRTLSLNRNRISMANGSDILISEEDTDFVRESRAKRKYKK